MLIHPVDIIGEARKALSEGREPPLPLLTLPDELADHPEVREIQHQFGLTPKGSNAVPAHLRTSSTQVEPATPPKWMTYAEAEEKVKQANQAWGSDESGPVQGLNGQFKKNKKERPTGMSPIQDRSTQHNMTRRIFMCHCSMLYRYVVM